MDHLNSNQIKVVFLGLKAQPALKKTKSLMLSPSGMTQTNQKFVEVIGGVPRSDSNQIKSNQIKSKLSSSV
jgi:hypothetical protein